MKRPGSLCVVGTGIQMMGQMTLESESAVRSATKLLYLVTEPVTESWLHSLNDSAENLWPFYKEEKPRIETYTEIVNHILGFVRAGENVCAAFYGHPGVFVYPSHEAIKQARAEGFAAQMLPGVSAEDCLFADLGIDPGWSGCQSFEATDFLVHSRKFDENVLLILWQVSCIGVATHLNSYSTPGLAVLCANLCETYGSTHEVLLYEAARFPVCSPVIHRVQLGALTSAPVTGISTLIVLPKAKSIPDLEMMKLLNMPASWPFANVRQRTAPR